LLALKETHPELAEAVDLHLALLDLQRRLLPRIPLPVLDLTPEQMAAHQARGLAVLTFDSIPVEVTDLRLLLRQTADVLHRFGMLEVDDFTRVQALGRDTGLLAQICDWFERSVERHAPSSRRAGGTTEEAPETGMLDYVIALAMKPYLTRCAEVLQPRQELALWTHGHCALCGGEPDLAVITPAAERHLICGQCSLHWNFEPLTCPFCGNGSRAKTTSFATANGRYRVYGCDVCRRYLKAYDARTAPRAVMPMVDGVATLPLDAAAQQRGYSG